MGSSKISTVGYNCLALLICISLPHSLYASWILQSSASSPCKTSSNEILCKSPPFVDDQMAIWNDPLIGEGKAYWKLTFEHADTYEVGVADREIFKRDHFLRKFYPSELVKNKNETNPAIDIIGIYCISSAKTLQVYFDVNGSSLGLVYEVPRSYLKEKIYPLTTFQAKRVAIVKSTEYPTIS